MYRQRKTAVLRLRLGGAQSSETLALDVQREYEFLLSIDGKAYPGGTFKSPLGDGKWRDVVRAIGELTQGADNRRYGDLVYGVGVSLFEALCNTSRALESFLVSETGPRRLVIQSNRPEIHQLPWEAMVNDDAESLAYGDISIIRTIDVFDEQPYISRPTLSIHGIFGPNTERLSLKALEDLEQSVGTQADYGLRITYTQEKTLPDEWFDNLQADIIHLEAHGDPVTGKVELPEWFNADDPVALAQRLRGGKIVLLWSCYSAMIHSWGESLAMRLHERGSVFVLSFMTPLRYKSSAEIARQFYTSVFSARAAIDPESTIVAERRRMHEEDLKSCDWAAMTLWLRQPLDLAAAVVNGPRLPEGGWNGSGARTDSLEKIASAFQGNAAMGRALLFTGESLDSPLPYDLVKEYRGAAIHLRGAEGLEDDRIFKELEVVPSQIRSHPGDRYLLLLETLATYSRSILIWSGVTAREVKLVDLLSAEIPKTLTVILVSADQIKDVSPNISVVAGEGATNSADEKSKVEADSSLRPAPALKRAKAPQTIDAWKKAHEEYEQWDQPAQLRHWIDGYRLFIGPNRRAEAEECLKAVEALDKVEGLLLRANFNQRNRLYNEARLAYTQALNSAANRRDKGRALLELGYLSAERGDRYHAEESYKNAINTLEQVESELRDPVWNDAIGRVLRDYADLLVTSFPDLLRADAARALECAGYLKRAMAIHAFDERNNQVGAVLRTRGKLAGLREQWDEAEAAFQSSASIFTSNGNQSGWSSTVRELAALSFCRKQYDQCLAILHSSLAQLNKKWPEDYPLEKGLLALQIARVYWSLGKMPEVLKWSGEALDKYLPDERRKEKAEATALRDFTQTLIG